MITDSVPHRLLRIFLCHATSDKQHARDLYRRLSSDGFGPWLDEESLLPGQSWRQEIPRAVRGSDIVLVCLSNNSISKSGYVQKEINLALAAAEEQPEGTIYIIPVRLEDCEVPERLSGWQWVNLFEEKGYEKLIKSLKHRATTLGETLSSSPGRSSRLPEGPKSVKEIRLQEMNQIRDGVHVTPPRAHTYSDKQELFDTAIFQMTDFGMEVGNRQTRIFHYARGLLLAEPSLVAINKTNNAMLAAGSDAESLLSSDDIFLSSPIKDDKIADPYFAARMLQAFLNKVCRAEKSNVRIVVAVPSELSEIERRAIIEAVYRAKVDAVYLVERALCGAAGAGLSIERTSGNMIIYVGESATEVMAISRGRSVSLQTARVGISSMINAIIDYIQRRYNLLIGEQTAYAIWGELGAAYPLEEPLSMTIRGRSLIEGIPKSVNIVDEDVREALADAISLIVTMVRDVFARTPPEVSADIIERGITLVGSGANLKLFDFRLSIETGLPVWVPDDPLTSVVKGASLMVSSVRLLKKEKLPRPLASPLLKLWNSTIGSLLSVFSSDLAIDIGERNTLVYAKGRGIVVAEPSIVAVDSLTYSLQAIGRDAKDMLGRTPGNILALHPIKTGVIVNFDMAVLMLKKFLLKAHNNIPWAMARVVIPVRFGLSRVERNALEDAAYLAGASEVYIVDETICAGIGSGLPIHEPYGNMILDIGGSATDVAVVSLSGIVYSKTLAVAGAAMDEAITQYVKRKYLLLIGERTAEAIKIEMGSAYPLEQPLSYEVRGRNLIEGVPKTVTITDEEVLEALADSLNAIIGAVRIALQEMPPELAADVVERGIMLTGGGALLQNMDKRLSIETGLPVSVADDPLASVILGAGKMLWDPNLLKRSKRKSHYR